MLQHLRDYSHIALKGHALVEEMLEQIIAQHCRAASVLESVNINFYIKAKLARALVGDPHGPDLWSLVWRLYLIRSSVVRTLENRGVRQSIGEFIRLASGWTKDTMPMISTDEHMASRFAGSIESVLGALAAIESEVCEGR